EVYSLKPYSPASEPEVKAFGKVLRDIRRSTSAGRFAGGIDLHGMITAYAFSYTLLGAGQRDYRKNALSVDTSIRTWVDQTRRMGWSPYVADANANGAVDTGEVCVSEPVLGGSSTRGRVPACVADQWGTVIDTIGYQVTGSMSDWFDSRLGLDGVGIGNEMYASHLAPNIVFDPALEQTHIDGNKGLIYSQIAALLTSGEVTYEPPGRIAYVHNPKRLRVNEVLRTKNPGLPAQEDIDVLIPCQDAVAQNLEGGCDGGKLVLAPSGAPAGMSFEFDVKGPAEGIWNGGITATLTYPSAAGVGRGELQGMQLQYNDEGQWQTIGYHFRQGMGSSGNHPGSLPSSTNNTDLYLPAGQVVTANDPKPGRYRIFTQVATGTPRLKIDFNAAEAEESAGQVKIDASSMDFFDDLNRSVPEGSKLEPVTVDDIVAAPGSLDAYDSLIVVNRMGDRAFVENDLGHGSATAGAYFAALKRFAQEGGNLVLTDAALRTLPELGIVPAGALRSATGTHANFAFQLGSTLSYTDPERFPLATDVMKPGAAEQETGRRQAVEPTPLGYTPATGLDATPLMTTWGVDRTAWNAACGLPDCSVALTASGGTTTNLGEAVLGRGRVRIAGTMFPDPTYSPDTYNDHRFGVASYALTYTAYEVFENLVDHRRR
ncbi:MAG TPA: hypothetical protein VM638_03810, partial [Actinomycetota bacterium]|nr:hypothetical protein [Actinomycetota bacterium]